jgi:hypothetical protein
VKKPCRGIFSKIINPQKARQQLYNKWCKEHQYYSGSYLPYKDSELVKQGWKNTSKSKAKKNKSYKKEATKQTVLYHKVHFDKIRKRLIPTHYHWDNPNKPKSPSSLKKTFYFLDKFGTPCAKSKDPKSPSHIKPHHTRRRKK